MLKRLACIAHKFSDQPATLRVAMRAGICERCRLGGHRFEFGWSCQASRGMPVRIPESRTLQRIRSR